MERGSLVEQLIAAGVVDVGLLDSLPIELWIDGFGEIAKHAAIRDAGLISLLAGAAGPGSLRPFIEEIVYRSLSIKADVVSRDELDTGERMMLNFGHTIGHAVEVASGYGGLSHGRCVAVGMAAITRNSEALGASETGTAETLVAMLHGLGLPTEVPRGLGEAYGQALALDKKGSGSKITLVLLRKMGDGYLRKLSRDEAAPFLRIPT